MPKPAEQEPSLALTSAIQSLYAREPEGFVAARAALAKQARADGDKDAAALITALRKPSVGAWAINQVARRRPEQTEKLVDVGGRLRAAQASLVADQLRSLRPERDGLINGFVTAAMELAADAGRPLAGAAQQEVRDSVIAALASEEASQAVVSGHLTRALSYSGFGEVDLSGAVVRSATGTLLSVVPGSGKTDAAGGRGGRGGPARESGAAAVKRAEEALAAAGKTADAAATAEAQARDEAEQAEQRVADLEAELKQAKTERTAAHEKVTETARERKRAWAARHTAEADLAEARGDETP